MIVGGSRGPRGVTRLEATPEKRAVDAFTAVSFLWSFVELINQTFRDG